MTESEKYMVALVEQDLKKLEEFGKGDTIMSEYIEEARDVSSKTNLWQSYDKELALKEDATMKWLEEGRKKKYQSHYSVKFYYLLLTLIWYITYT